MSFLGTLFVVCCCPIRLKIFIFDVSVKWEDRQGGEEKKTAQGKIPTEEETAKDFFYIYLD